MIKHLIIIIILVLIIIILGPMSHACNLSAEGEGARLSLGLTVSQPRIIETFQVCVKGHTHTHTHTHTHPRLVRGKVLIYHW